MAISDNSTLIIQGFNLFIFLMIVLIALGIWLLSGVLSSTFYVLGIGFVFWGPVIFIFLKLREVQLTARVFLVRNIFGKNQFEKSQFHKIEKTILSPIVYRICFKNSSNYYFMAPMEYFFKSIFSLGSDYALGKMNDKVNAV